MDTIKEVNSAIMYGTFTNQQLDSIIDAVKFRRTAVARENANTLRIGSDVYFISNRNGRKYQGKLEAIKIKNAIVNTALGKYRVPLNMIAAV
jgi:hypothetical protein